MKVKLWIYIQNNGDGSASPLFFNESEAAQLREDFDLETYGEIFCDSFAEYELEFDKNGILLNPDFPTDEKNEY